MEPDNNKSDSISCFFIKIKTLEEIMPEIPEMENYRSLLNQSINAKKITSVEVNRSKTINIPVEDFVAKVQGQSIKEVARRAKFLVFQLADGNFLLLHLMLDGRITLTPVEEKVKAQVIFFLVDGNKLNFSQLHLGYLHYHTPKELRAELENLGVEPLSEDFTWQGFQQLLKGRRGVIKTLLMNQKVIAGLGNAYSNEALFAARLMPDRKVAGLEEEEKKHLFEVIPSLLRKAIAAGGDLDTPYSEEDIKTGGFNTQFQVYERTGEPCYVCGNLIEQAEIGGRNAFFCRICQK